MIQIVSSCHLCDCLDGGLSHHCITCSADNYAKCLLFIDSDCGGRQVISLNCSCIIALLFPADEGIIIAHCQQTCLSFELAVFEVQIFSLILIYFILKSLTKNPSSPRLVSLL